VNTGGSSTAKENAGARGGRSAEPAKVLRLKESEEHASDTHAETHATRVTKDGLKAFAHLVEKLETEPGSTIVFAHHFGPEARKQLADLLAKDPHTQVTEAMYKLQKESVATEKELKHRAAELHKATDALENILSGIQTPLIIVGNDLHIKRWSAATEEILQMKLYDAGRKITNVGLSVQIPDLEALITEVISTQKVMEREVTDESGRWFSVVVRPYRTHENKIEGAVLTFVDIDDRKRNEEMVRTSQAKERMYLDLSHNVLLALDASLNVTMINRTGAEILGVSESEIVGKHWIHNFVPKQYAIAVRTIFDQLLNADLDDEYEYPVATRGDEERVISWRSALLKDAEGKVTGVMCSGEDLTMLRQINAALHQSEERFHLMMESVREDEFFIMDKEGFIVSWIALREEGKSYSAEEALGRHFSSFYSPDDFQSGKPMRILETAEAEGRYEEDGWRLRKDGSRMRAYVIVAAIRDEAHNLIGYSNVTRYLRERAEPKELPILPVPLHSDWMP
jgi:PAS domain S-box-containing protein